MNVVREINKINERELDLGISGSWHDDYKDSAYIFVGGLHADLTEGDVITVFSQYGEVMDVNMPRHTDTGKPKGFAFLMYEDQRSTVLAVDNLNGATVLERTLRVDHVKNYKQPKLKTEEGESVDREEQSLNAKPELIMDEGTASEESEDDGPPIDPEDPMHEYLVAKRKEEKAEKKAKKQKSKSKRKDETPEERRARKERKKKRKEKSEAMKGVEDLLKSLGAGGGDVDMDRPRRRSPTPDNRDRLRKRTRSRTPLRERDQGDRAPRYRSPDRRRSISRDRSPVRDERGSRRLYSRSPGRSYNDRHGQDGFDDRKHGRYDSSPPRRRGDRS